MSDYDEAIINKKCHLLSVDTKLYSKTRNLASNLGQL